MSHRYNSTTKNMSDSFLNKKERKLRYGKKISVATTFILMHLLNILYTIIQRIYFLKSEYRYFLLRKITNEGKNLYISLGISYHIGVRTTLIPSKFKVKLYEPVDPEKMKKLHQEFSELRKQRVAEQELSNTNY